MWLWNDKVGTITQFDTSGVIASVKVPSVVTRTISQFGATAVAAAEIGPATVVAVITCQLAGTAVAAIVATPIVRTVGIDQLAAIGPGVAVMVPAAATVFTTVQAAGTAEVANVAAEEIVVTRGMTAVNTTGTAFTATGPAIVVAGTITHSIARGTGDATAVRGIVRLGSPPNR